MTDRFNPSLPPSGVLNALLAAADDFATANVEAGAGGPFGASLHVYDWATKQLLPIGGLRANAVLRTGLASAHAEDQALAPDMVRELTAFLAGRHGHDVSVILASSAESCPACHAKAEIIARRLMADGLIAQGRFFVLYGATYQDSLAVAGFNDEIYHRDMQQAADARLIRQTSVTLAELPPAVADIFKGADRAAAVIMTADGTLIAGHDLREHDALATAEVTGIRYACQHQTAKGSATPWDLGGATLYTPTAAIGPLAYAEAQWANVTSWVTITDLPPAWRTVEAPGISNDALLRTVAARPYNQAGSAVRVMHLTPFANRAQQAWRERQDAGTIVNYNGIIGK